jgi:hypothetical protein
MWLTVVGLALIMLLGAGKYVISTRSSGSDPLATLSGGRTVAVGLDIGGVPTDYDLQSLAESYHVDGVINISAPDIAEQVSAATLHLAYMHLPVASGAAPTRLQLRTLARFMRSHTSRGAHVYVHDDAGGGRVVAIAEMLLLLRGESRQKVQQEMTAGERGSLSAGQSKAIGELATALNSPGYSSPGNPYAGSQIYSW